MAVSPARFVGESAMQGTAAAGNKIYIRSTAAADRTAELYGLDSGGDAVGELLSAAAGRGQIENLSGNTYDALTLLIYDAALTGAAQIRSNDGQAAAGAIHVHALPSNGDTLTFGLVGFTETITWTTGTPSAGQVKIGANVDECADNLASFLNDSSTGSSSPVDGTDWSATAANAYVSATVSGSNVTITDLVNCSRALGWDITPSDPSDVVVTEPAGGVDGTLIQEMQAGLTSISTSGASGVDLDQPDLGLDTLPESLTGAAAGIPVRGAFRVRIKCNSPGASVTAKIQMSSDGETWWDAPSTTITDLNSDQDQVLTGSDLFAEWARLNITGNSAASPFAADVQFYYQS